MLPDGSSYVGGWEGNAPQGFGRFMSAANGPSYKGQWQRGEWEGEGAMVGESLWYRGKFHAGEPHGEGVMVTSVRRVRQCGANTHTGGRPVRGTVP